MQAVDCIEKSNKDVRATTTARGACPTYFRALCATAQAGGESSYGAAGYELTRHIADEMPDDLDRNQTHERLDALDRALRNNAADEVIATWFKQNVPRCMALVPTRRRGMFVQGVRGRFNEVGAIER